MNLYVFKLRNPDWGGGMAIIAAENEVDAVSISRELERLHAMSLTPPRLIGAALAGQSAGVMESDFHIE